MSAKVPATLKLAKRALMEDKCVVIGLQSTGEARTEEAVTKYVCISWFQCNLMQIPRYSIAASSLDSSFYAMDTSFLICPRLFVRVSSLMILFLDHESCC